jgi:hypothetical protein
MTLNPFNYNFNILAPINVGGILIILVHKIIKRTESIMQIRVINYVVIVPLETQTSTRITRMCHNIQYIRIA